MKQRPKSVLSGSFPEQRAIKAKEIAHEPWMANPNFTNAILLSVSQHSVPSLSFSRLPIKQ